MRNLFVILTALGLICSASGCAGMHTCECQSKSPEVDFKACHQYIVDHNISVNCNIDSKMDSENRENGSDVSVGHSANGDKRANGSNRMRDIEISLPFGDASQTDRDTSADDPLEQVQKAEEVQKERQAVGKEVMFEMIDARIGADKDTKDAQRKEPADIGFLTITSKPWAVAALNGNRIGSTPIKSYKVKPGSYELVLTNPGIKKVHRQSVTVKSGDDLTIVVDLDD